MNFLKLIEENKVNDLSSRVFKQKLDKSSTGTFTAVLTEQEENACVQKMLDNHPTGAWRDFVVQYFNHYPPCNSSVELLLNNLHLVVARDLLKLVIKKNGILEEQAKKLCQTVLREDIEHSFHLVQDYCRNPRRLNVDSTLLLLLHNIDDKYADRGDIHVKLADVYQKSVKDYGRSITTRFVDNNKE